ncbi:hypothetical protein E6P09_19175 (plasmid) [Haloferax mediterranei ATCC 33500]|uniref:Uncharacterized protein n=1 Tax=Haloferax mediterranei (strain ATCC 33500 / DSM 1411 / JCM 8866 / NBRC 14739 / NCIMB 2177 / R-4) TaxID=523841 RepID=I3R948_HALMT|nr:hypothetical protein HFX_4064 [Haloferax mediterranei ATCC 33500]ELZ97571.1 hypothetical protein C439_16683 [Haloferax mediterranei ATCC 33500]QCQ77435.1 hypothetical protein E6P09_19175 [Haloferax mediterranei ATCC 33500]
MPPHRRLAEELRPYDEATDLPDEQQSTHTHPDEADSLPRRDYPNVPGDEQSVCRTCQRLLPADRTRCQLCSPTALQQLAGVRETEYA